MSDSPFRSTDALRFGWEATVRSFLPLFLPLGVLSAILGVVESGAQNQGQSLFHFVLQLVTAFVTIGWWRVALRTHDGQVASLGALGETTLPLYLQYLVTLVLFWVAVVVGLVLLVVPGIVLGARLCLGPVVVVDQGLDAVSALRRSWDLTEGRTAEMIVLGLFLAALNLLGALALGLGLLGTVPTSYVAVAYVYRRLAASGPAPISAPGAPVAA